jgi:SAM-dependent methyltransferase
MANSSREYSMVPSSERGAFVMIPQTIVRAGSLLRRLRSQRRNGNSVPAVGRVRFGSLRRTRPVSEIWGFDRGRAIDRYYIEQFLCQHASDIRGHVLEIADDYYSRRFGGDRVTKVDVLHVADRLPKVTIIADLTSADLIPSETFDCIVLTQTLQFIYDVRAVVETLHRILKPEGVVLATCGGITKASAPDMERWGDYWRFTAMSARRLFEESFPADRVSVQGYGNVLTATAFLYGLAVEELSSQEMDTRDSNFEVTIGVKAVKAPSFASDEHRS